MPARKTLIYLLAGGAALTVATLGLQPFRRATFERQKVSALQVQDAAPEAPAPLEPAQFAENHKSARKMTRDGESGAPLSSSATVAPTVLEAMASGAKLVRTGNVVIEVSAFDDAFAQLQRIVSDQGGYIANLSARSHVKGMAQGTIQIRVLPARYFQTLDALRSLGKVVEEGVSTQDITREFADLESRIKHKREVEARMREIFKGHATTMDSLIRAERELASVGEDLERMEGERRYFQQLTSLSTITVDLREQAVPLKSPSPSLFAPLREAVTEGFSALVKVSGAALYACILLGPYALLGWAVWRNIRRFRETRS
jgi:hypothetical protein